jgi:hypothetical protein
MNLEMTGEQLLIPIFIGMTLVYQHRHSVLDMESRPPQIPMIGFFSDYK